MDMSFQNTGAPNGFVPQGYLIAQLAAENNFFQKIPWKKMIASSNHFANADKNKISL